MKLIYCPKCDDVRKIHSRATRCKCQKSWGRYLPDGLHATYGGKAIPLGFDNPSFLEAIKQQRGYTSSRFRAFVIQRECPTFKQVTAPAPAGGE